MVPVVVFSTVFNIPKFWETELVRNKEKVFNTLWLLPFLIFIKIQRSNQRVTNVVSFIFIRFMIGFTDIIFGNPHFEGDNRNL